MFTYTSYSLSISSTFPLPELRPITLPPTAPAEVSIRLGTLPKPRPGGLSRPFGDEEEYCLLDGIGDFLVRHGREIVVEPQPEVEPAILRHYLLGWVMATLLRQRGILMLHASAVAVAGRAIIFFGPSGRGKSTTAAAFVRQGATLLADDYAAIRFDGDLQCRKCELLPSFPRLRLTDRSARLLSRTAERVPPYTPETQKHSYAIAQEELPLVPPLRRIYLLAEGESIRIEAVEPQPTFFDLTLGTHIRHRKMNPTLQARLFRQCSQLARTVPMRRLNIPRRLAVLPELVRLVEADLADGG
ncbi:MAG TPA: hypothetical protein VJ302_10230 [Blastocatellia bacterium]|nr:hypothetical protein [Blastocatellia bacterium]